MLLIILADFFFVKNSKLFSSVCVYIYICGGKIYWKCENIYTSAKLAL